MGVGEKGEGKGKGSATTRSWKPENNSHGKKGDKHLLKA